MLGGTAQTLFKIFLTAIALLPAVWVFVIAQEWSFKKVMPSFPDCIILSHCLFFIFVIVASRLAFETRHLLEDDEIPKGTITDVSPANDGFLPSYLGYFFVALTIDEWLTFFFIFLFISLFVYSSRISYLNPILFLFGYNFFLVRSQGVESLIITKRDLRSPSSLCFKKLKRVNDYTFIDMEV